MRLPRSVPVVLSCAAVALTGCGASSLLDGSTASELQESLSRVRAAIDDGRCAQARTAAREGSERVDELPSSVDGELRDRLRQGFDELAARVESDCVPPTTTAPPTTTTEPEPVPEPTTTTTPSEPDPPTTTTDPTPTEPDTEPLEPVDPTDPVDPDDGSGGVVPGVDGPGASERSAPGRGSASSTLQRRWNELKDRAREYFGGQGRG